GLQASAIAGLATGVGAVPVLGIRRLSPRAEDVALAFAGGVMLAATFFSLLIPGLAQARIQVHGAFAGAALVSAAVLLGALLIWIIHRHLPHEHGFKGREGGPAGVRLARAWLLVLAIALHNIPEGLAVGVGASAEIAGIGLASDTLTIAIAVQNMPEGLVVAIALVTIGMRRTSALLAALLSGLVEPVAGTIGAFGAALSTAALPWALGLA
ncbi:MAG: ZIP family metal transporter, partial [Anaerolineales bacterium]|nr:ZIP family metal transporter [Anaerolineales bacterium]